MKIIINHQTAVAASTKFEVIPFTGTNGLYSAVTPMSDHVSSVVEIAKELGLEVDEDKLHVTIVYSKVNPVEPGEVEAFTRKDEEHKAIIYAVDSWVGHNGKTYIVLKLVSEALTMQNAMYHQLGAEHTFIPYAPHITLSKDIEVDDEMKAKFKALNKKLAIQPVQILLSGQFAGDLD